jgi:HK97 family phage portal protein
MEDYEIVQGHDFNRLLISANPYQSTYQLFVDIFTNLEVTGDAYIHVVSTPDGKPSQLYVLESQYCYVIPAAKGSGKLISHYEFRKNAAEVTRFEEDEIIKVSYPNINSIWYGYGKVEKAWAAHLLNRYSHEYQTALYANNNVPAYLLINKSGQSLSKKRWWKQMSNQNRGPRNAGKSMAVDADVDIKSIAHTPKDLSDIALNIQEIASVTGCPISVLLGSDNVKANTEQQNTSWLRNTVLPMMMILSSTLTEQLLWRYGIGDGEAFLMFDNPVPEDKEFQLKSDESRIKNAIMSPNEVRSAIGLDPVESGDVLYHNGSELGVVTSNPIPNPNENTQETDDDKKMAIVMGEIDQIIKGLENDEEKEPVPAPTPFVINISNDSDIIEEVIDEQE